MPTPITNCHTHIFTGDHVPPLLAKTFIPWPFYHILRISWLVSLFRFWYRVPYTWQFKPWFMNCKEAYYKLKMFIKRHWILALLNFCIGLFLTVHVFFILFDWLTYIATGNETAKWFSGIRIRLEEWRLLHLPTELVWQLLLVVALFIFFKPGRNLVFFILKKIWKFLGVLPGPESKKLAQRYLNIGRFAFYGEQTRVFNRLKAQYPEGTRFVILPMDMEFMDAGSLGKDSRYKSQMEALASIKKNPRHADLFLPFVFADPRRMAKEGAAHFDYTFGKDSNITLEDCFMKTYLADLKFSGIKIYPALGYYPFDETLLPLWKYAADNGIPIITHCIRGTIFFRGSKHPDWDYHPIIRQAAGDNEYERMLLPETKNRDFINNFTHPLNYLCLLEEKLLRQVVCKAKDGRLKLLFGYTDEKTPLQHDLAHLKLCFGHFGGDDEWNRFLEMDRDNYGSQLVRHPDKGISFLTNDEGTEKHGKLEQIWKYADWYSIICSMMLQYPNVYADLSYILHDDSIQPLLAETLRNPGLRGKVLFGTDFYVVRNHKSEKNMLACMMGKMSPTDFDQIARINPQQFIP